MTKGYILITDDNPRPKRTSPKPRTKPRKPDPDDEGIIEIVETAPRSRASPTKAKAKISQQEASREIVKDSSGSKSAGEGAGGKIVKDSEGPSATGAPASAISRLATSTQKLGATINYGDTLPDCNCVEEVRAWLIRQQVDFNEKVHRAFNWRRLLDETRAKAEAILHQAGAVSGFHLGNGRLCLAAFENLRASISAHVSADPNNELALITFIPGEGGTSMDRPVIDVRQSRKAANDVMRKTKAHWFGAVDTAFFWTVQHPDGGLHLQGHQHVLGWSPGFIEKMQEVAEKSEPKFKPNVTNLPVIKVVEAWDCTEVNIARLCAYLLKAPAKGKNWFEQPNGRDIMNHTEAKDRFIQFLRLAQVRSVLGDGDVFLAGGDGVDMRSALVTELRSLAIADARGKASMHPGLVPTFWEDFNQELGQSHWSLPAILR